MKKVLLILFLAVLMYIPLTVKAEEIKATTYKDKLYEVLDLEESEKIRIYFFHSRVCPHCMDEEEWLQSIKRKYGNKIEIVKYQVYKNEKNSELLKLSKKEMGEKGQGVPFTVIGEKTFLGYSSIVGDEMENLLDEYVTNIKSDSLINLPLIGEVELGSISLPFLAIILGTLDGFNPCAMWILLFLINMLFNMKDRKKMWLLGLTFLFTSAFVYFLAMLGLSVVLGYSQTLMVQKIIAIVAITGGLLNLNSYLTTKEDGCHVVDKKKRNKYFNKIKKFTTEKNIWLALLGVVTLAASVNLVELACSAGFPTIFVEMMNINYVTGLPRILYLLLYIIFFLIDDIVVFVIAMKTLEVSGLTTKYNKLSHLIGGIIMIIIGLLLMFKPEWIMLNF